MASGANGVARAAAGLALVLGAGVALAGLAALMEVVAALAEGVAAALAGAWGGLDWLELGPASRFAWQLASRSTRPATRGARVTGGV